MNAAMTTTDVAIIGGGVMGSATAYFLRASRAAPHVTVIERDPTYRLASSALSASSIRQQFSTPENIRMSRFSFDWLREADRHLAVDDGPVDIGLRERGYLYLAPPERVAVLRDNHAIQRAEGADVVLLTADELGSTFPWLATTGVALASLGRSGEGWFDCYALTRAFRAKARALGATYVPAEAVDLEVRGGRVATVRLDDGARVAAPFVVDAAGPWAARVAAMAGVRLPVEARRRSVFAFDAPDAPRDSPLIVDTSGLWVRPEGEGFIAGIAPPDADDHPDLPLEPDRRQFDDVLWPALAARVPAFDALRVRRAWAGYYEVNTFDHNAILGPSPDVPNLLFVNGFSGHGIQQAPAVGRALAELITDGRYVSLDLSVFGYERIAAGRQVVERNVIG